MINSNLYYPIESKAISSKNRFVLKATDILKFENYIKLQKYLRLTFKNLNHLKKLPKLVKLRKCIYNINKKFILND